MTSFPVLLERRDAHGVRGTIHVAVAPKTRMRLFVLHGGGSAPPILETSADLPRDATNEEGAAIGSVVEAAEQAKLRSVLDEADGPVAIHGIDLDHSNIGVACWCPDIRADFDVAHDSFLAKTSGGLAGSCRIYLSLDDAVLASFSFPNQPEMQDRLLLLDRSREGRQHLDLYGSSIGMT